jgi:hypothetical protein
VNRIEDDFRSRGLVDGGLLMLRPSDAIKLVRACRDQRIRVDVVEGFRLYPKGHHLYPNGGTQPFMEHTLGLAKASDDADAEDNCWDLAEEFLERYLTTDLYFNLTLPPE